MNQDYTTGVTGKFPNWFSLDAHTAARTFEGPATVLPALQP